MKDEDVSRCEFRVSCFRACIIQLETRNSQHETFAGWFYEERELR